MVSSTREIVSVSTGAGVLVALTAMRFPPVIGGGAALLSYAVVRALLPGPGRSLESGGAREVRLLAASGRELEAIRRLSRTRAVARSPLGEPVGELVDVVEKLVRCFEESPERWSVAAHFPAKLTSLREMLDDYLRLSAYRSDTAVADDALARTERVIPVATRQFRTLLGRLLEEDVVRLAANARVYEELMDFEV